MLATRLAWSVALLCGLLAVPTVVLLALGAGTATPADDFGAAGFGGLALLVAFLTFAVVGALIVSGVPGNSIGPLFCVIGSIGTIGDFAYQCADFSVYVSPGAFPGAEVFGLMQNLGLPPTFGLLAIALLLFPDGRPLSRRWRPAVWIAYIGVASIVLGYILVPGPIEFPFETLQNPLGVAGLRTLSETALIIGWLLMGVAIGLAGIAITLRFRRSSGVARQQIKWIAFVGAVAGVVLVANAVSFFLSVTGIDTLRMVVVGTTFSSFPIAAGIAILRYRLYDIDLVVKRTLVYAALTATLAVAYTGGVLLLQFALHPLTERSELAVAGSTLAVAALFGPARRRIQREVDRRFYRTSYDATRTLAIFTAGLRDQVDLGTLADDLRLAIESAMQPTHVSLWLNEGR